MKNFLQNDRYAVNEDKFLLFKDELQKRRDMA